VIFDVCHAIRQIFGLSCAAEGARYVLFHAGFVIAKPYILKISNKEYELHIAVHDFFMECPSGVEGRPLRRFGKPRRLNPAPT
jgi:hypothetical protein